MPKVKTVQIARSPSKGFGFSVIGGSNTHLPPMICALVHGGPAASSGKIEIGDIVEQVNGINARDLPTRSNHEARSLAKPFLSNEVISSAPNEIHTTRIASVIAKKPANLPKSPENREISGKKSGRKSSSSSVRTVGSPDYDRLGADGRFVKSGSLDRQPSGFVFDNESTDRAVVKDDESPLKSDKLSTKNERFSPKNDSLPANDDESWSGNEHVLLNNDKSGKVGNENTKKTGGSFSAVDLSLAPLKEANRLSNPLFGSSPRLNGQSTNKRNMKQNSSHNNIPNIIFHNMQRPSLHRRSASNDEHDYTQRQPTAQDYRAPVFCTAANVQNTTDTSRVARSGPTVRFEDSSSQQRTNQPCAVYPPKDRRGVPQMANGGAGGAYGNAKPSNNAQDLRNAFVKHQIALRNQKLAGFSQRRYNSSEELPSHSNSFRPIYHDSPVQISRGMATGKDSHSNKAESFVEDDDDMHESGYSVGFRRTNSLGRADMYQRYSRNQDFYFTDRTHVNQYKDNETKQNAQVPRLSPALQQRLLNATSSSMTNYYANTQVTTIPTRNSANFDQYSKSPDTRTDNYGIAQVSPRTAPYNTSSSSTYGGNYSMGNGVVMRDTEDGMVQSRYEHGKSLAVPFQQFPEEYFAATADNSGLYDKKRSSLTSRTSVGSRMSDIARADLSSPVRVPDDLKTIDATDLATRLFMLDGFKSEEVAPLLGKNTEFSQQVCSEYMKFLNFEGYAIDEALRIFLQKFPLTGETQERERILLQFSKRYHESNKQLYGSEDSVHTLTCALMLLNTDLHGQNIGTKMTLNEFVNNLSGMCDGVDFSRELLKTLYQSIKNKEIQYAYTEAPKEIKPSPKTRKPSSNGNPFIELKAHDNAVLMREGMMYRKCLMDSDGKRVPAPKRSWKIFYSVLKGLVLFLQKPDKAPGGKSIGIHHSLAGFATEYKKRSFVFKLITADWSVCMFQARSKSDVQDWVDSINLSAAALSSPPLPAPCSSSQQFSRPVMPVSVTRLSLEEQIKRHAERAESIDKDMQDHREIQPNESSKDFKDWENKMDYLEFEYKRFSAYAKVLSTPRLKDKLNFLLSTRDKPIPRTDEAPSNRPMRSSSMNDMGMSNNTSPASRRRMRQSYIRAVQN